MSGYGYHMVTVETENGDVRTYRVRDVNHWESGVLELVFEDGHSKIIKKYAECEVSELLDSETDEPITTLHEVNTHGEPPGITGNEGPVPPGLL